MPAHWYYGSHRQARFAGALMNLPRERERERERKKEREKVGLRASFAAQVASDYGPGGITGYVAPVQRLQGSIMSNSNTDGGGRGQFHADRKSIIGDVINHGKKQYWKPGACFPASCAREEVARDARRVKKERKESRVSTDSPRNTRVDSSFHYHATLRAGENTLEVPPPAAFQHQKKTSGTLG